MPNLLISCFRNLLSALCCGYMLLEHPKPLDTRVQNIPRTCTVGIYLERTKHIALWTRALRTYRVTLHSALFSLKSTEHFVLCTRTFGTYRSLRTVSVCVRNALNTLLYVLARLEHTSCVSRCAESTEHLVLWIHALTIPCI
jgi:hypothetical protein